MLAEPSQHFGQQSPIVFLDTERIAKAVGSAKETLFDARIGMSRRKNELNETLTHVGVWPLRAFEAAPSASSFQTVCRPTRERTNTFRGA